MAEQWNPLAYLARTFELDSFEQYCVGRVLHEKSDGGGIPAEKLAEGFGKLSGYHPYFWPESRLMRYFFLRTPEGGLVMDPRMAVFLQGDLAEYEPYALLWELVIPEPYPGGDSGEEKRAERETAEPEKTGDKTWRPEEKERETASVMDRFMRERTAGQPAYIHLYGNPGVGRSESVLELCRRRERSLLILDSRVLEEEDGETLRLALRECRLYGAYLMIRDLDPGWFMPSVYRERLFRRMADEAGAVFTTGTSSVSPGNYLRGIAFLEIGLGMPDFAESCALWEKEFAAPDCGLLDAGEWANKFVFTRGQIREAVENARRYAFVCGRKQLTREDLRRGCYHLMQGGMGKRAIRIEARYTWEELVLPPRQKERLRDACNQAAYRKNVYEAWGFDQKISYGKGLSIVFAGPPGTGKTMAAQVMASELCMDLYRIDLAAAVSKYIGETEKNLEEIFEQAKKSQVILLFDEADVLFSRRTEVRDSNDKYSNMEAAFLLQKMEEYEGITVLATNFLQNFDEAFKRRMKFIIDFPFPEAEQRGRIWRQVFPEQTPVEGDLDYEFLAGAFEMSGSNIKNAALHAAFLAAASGSPVSMKHIVDGIRNEFAKSGKQLTREQLGQYYMLL